MGREDWGCRWGSAFPPPQSPHRPWQGPLPPSLCLHFWSRCPVHLVLHATLRSRGSRSPAPWRDCRLRSTEVAAEGASWQGSRPQGRVFPLHGEQPGGGLENVPTVSSIISCEHCWHKHQHQHPQQFVCVCVIVSPTFLRILSLSTKAPPTAQWSELERFCPGVPKGAQQTWPK